MPANVQKISGVRDSLVKHVTSYYGGVLVITRATQKLHPPRNHHLPSNFDYSDTLRDSVAPPSLYTLVALFYPDVITFT